MDNTAKLTQKLVLSAVASTGLLETVFNRLLEEVRIKEGDCLIITHLLSIAILISNFKLIADDGTSIEIELKQLLPRIKTHLRQLQQEIDKNEVRAKEEHLGLFIRRASIECENEDVKSLMESLQEIVLIVSQNEEGFTKNYINDLIKLKDFFKSLRKSIKQEERAFTQKVVAITRAA